MQINEAMICTQTKANLAGMGKICRSTRPKKLEFVGWIAGGCDLEDSW